jgi:hypothetical protein
MKATLAAALAVALIAVPSAQAASGGLGPAVLSPPPVSSAAAARIAQRLAAVRAAERRYPRHFAQVTNPALGQWQVAFYSHNQEFIQVLVSSADGHVLGVYTGYKIAWTMARGYPGAFGRHLDALYVWLPLCFLFLAPFFDWRRPWAIRNLDLLALTSLSISLAFFNHADINTSVPLVYPPLAYLLGRLLWIARPRAARQPPLRLNVAPRVLLVLLLGLVGFRVALNVDDSNVIDVGYANVVGAQKVLDGSALYGSFPAEIARGDTYGPVAYEAYAPFVAAFGFDGAWGSLPAAHAAAIFFDSLAIVLLLALGWRIRGPSTGIVLAYAWAAFPFTAFALESNSNDALVASLVLAALLLATSPPARGALAALAGLTKFAPLALAPLLASHRRPGLRGLAGFVVAFAAAAALALYPALAHNTLSQVFNRTVTYQADRSAPFSIWGLYGGLGVEQAIVQAGAVALALALALVPRRDDLVGLCAAAAAVLIAVQLGVSYWFYLYIPWFFAPAIVAVLAGSGVTARSARARGRGRRAWITWDGVRGAWLIWREKRLLSGGRARAVR